MAMKLSVTDRDRWFLAALPLVAAALLAWYYAAPRVQAALAERERAETLGSEDELRDRIAFAESRLAAARRDLEAAREQLSAPPPGGLPAKGRAGESSTLPPLEPAPILDRLNLLLELCRDAGLQVPSVARVDANRSGSLLPGDLPVPPAAEYWTCTLRGTLPEVLDLLSRFADAPTHSLVDSLALRGEYLPGQPADWTLTLWL